MSLSYSDYPQHVHELAHAARAAVSPKVAVQRHLRINGRSLQVGGDSILHTHSLDDNDRVFLVSAGVAALPMALAASQILGRRLTLGQIIAPRETVPDPETTVADHPNLELYPAGRRQDGILTADEGSIEATAAARELLGRAKSHDLVLVLLSEGAASLLTHPQMPLPTWRQLYRALSDDDDRPWLTVARQLDAAKNGGVARWAGPATCVTLALSHRVGNPKHLIGGGPTIAGPDTLADAIATLGRRRVGTTLQTAAWRQVVQALHQAQQRSSPPPHGHYLVVGDGRVAAMAALVKAAQLGFAPQILTTHLEAEARETGRVAAALARDAQPDSCFILAGKTAISPAEKDGARNQALALSAALALEGREKRVVVALDSSGRDGASSVAGAAISGETAGKSRTVDLDPAHYLRRYDSAAFFAHLDRDQADCPPTRLQLEASDVNVNDLIFILAYAN